MAYLPNSEHWSIVINYCGRLAEVIGFGDFLAIATCSKWVSNKYWESWLCHRVKTYVLKRYGQGEDFWTALRKHEGVISGSTIALAAWGFDLLPCANALSPSSLYSDLDVYVPEANAGFLRGLLLERTSRNFNQMEKSQHSEVDHLFKVDRVDTWTRRNVPEADDSKAQPYEDLGRDDLASVSNIVLRSSRNCEYEDCATVAESHSCSRTRPLQIIGLKKKIGNADVPQNRRDIIRWIENEFDHSFLANTFDGHQITVRSLHDLITQTGPNRWLENGCKFKVVPFGAEFAWRPLNGNTVRALARILKYQALGCTISNVNKLVVGMDGKHLLANGLPRWVIMADCSKYFSSGAKFGDWIDLLLKGGIRISPNDENLVEIISFSDAENLLKGDPGGNDMLDFKGNRGQRKPKTGPPFFCKHCLPDADMKRPWKEIRDGRYCMRAGYCRSLYLNKWDSHMDKQFIKRFRTSPDKDVCELHYSKYSKMEDFSCESSDESKSAGDSKSCGDLKSSG